MESKKVTTNAPESTTPANLKIDPPKVTAVKELSAPTNPAAPPITFESLLAMDIVQRNARGAFNASSATNDARKYLNEIDKNLTSAITDNALAVLIASVGRNTEVARRAGKRAATALALIDVNRGFQRIVNPATGMPFKNTSSLFRALYPTLADSTIWNYVNVGKEIYLPAQAPDAPEYLKVLAELEPGTALSAVGALKDEASRKRLPAAIKTEMKAHGGKLTQSALKAAAKAARNPGGTKPKEDGTKGTEAKDGKAQSDTAMLEKREALKAGLRAWIQRGLYDGATDETPFTVSSDCRKEGETYLRNAIKNGDANLVLEIMIDFFVK